jgi:PKD repeat protein
MPEIRYPDALDAHDNLHLVHDLLLVHLSSDYNPGDTSIKVSGDTSGFPPSGILTMTEQSGDPSERAVTFSYSAVGVGEFTGIEVLDISPNVFKPAIKTKVTQNVVADHHNAIKDALISVQEFIGVKGTLDVRPFGETVEGRVNFLRKLVLKPRAWFRANRFIGIVPLTVEFIDLSFRSPTNYCWKFGDDTVSSISLSSVSCASISSLSSVLSVVSNPSTYPGGGVLKTYYTPGIFDVYLEVSNDFGSDILEIPGYITARLRAPEEAIIDFEPDNATQSLVGDILKTRTDSIVSVFVSDSGEQIGDPIIEYIWNLQDDLVHDNSSTALASYSRGGIYNVILRANTNLGAYRITKFIDKIDVIEKTNLWLVTTPDTSDSVTKSFNAYEYGMLSGVFKTTGRTSVSVDRDPGTLGSGTLGTQRVGEFKRNCGLHIQGGFDSGDKGMASLYWASDVNNVKFRNYNGFSDFWSTPVILSTMSRVWNWVDFKAATRVYFVLGTDVGAPNYPTNQLKQSVSLATGSVSNDNFVLSDYKNGAEDLITNSMNFVDGNFSVYRSCFNNGTGFLVRNEDNGVYFRFKQFYRTEGTVAEELAHIRKLTDIPGTIKTEGQLVALTDGVYLFNNTGEVVVWNNTAAVWQVGGPGIGSPAFRVLQDISVSGHDNASNTLLAAGDGDRRAYLSFDYSSKAFTKFNEASLTFTSAGPRPEGEQLVMSIF